MEKEGIRVRTRLYPTGIRPPRGMTEWVEGIRTRQTPSGQRPVSAKKIKPKPKKNTPSLLKAKHCSPNAESTEPHIKRLREEAQAFSQPQRTVTQAIPQAMEPKDLPSAQRPLEVFESAPYLTPTDDPKNYSGVPEDKNRPTEPLKPATVEMVEAPGALAWNGNQSIANEVGEFILGRLLTEYGQKMQFNVSIENYDGETGNGASDATDSSSLNITIISKVSPQEVKIKILKISQGLPSQPPPITPEGVSLDMPITGQVESDDQTSPMQINVECFDQTSLIPLETVFFDQRSSTDIKVESLHQTSPMTLDLEAESFDQPKTIALYEESFNQTPPTALKFEPLDRPSPVTPELHHDCVFLLDDEASEAILPDLVPKTEAEFHAAENVCMDKQLQPMNTHVIDGSPQSEPNSATKEPFPELNLIDFDLDYLSCEDDSNPNLELITGLELEFAEEDFPAEYGDGMFN